MQQRDPAEVLYHRRCAKYVYVVPEGLRELMTDISREVLRQNPTQLYYFISEFLDTLLVTRENAKVAAKLVESLTETGVIIAELLIQTNISRDQADRAAGIIQRAFRRHLRDKAAAEPLADADLLQKITQRARVSMAEASRAVGIIQRAFRHYRARRRGEGGEIDWWLAARHTIGILDKLKVPRAELDRCATLIKAAYKGYYMRKNIKRLLEEASRLDDSELSDIEYMSSAMEEESVREFEDDQLQRIHNEVLNHAATVIQKAYRTYAARKHVLCGVNHDYSFLEVIEMKVTQRRELPEKFDMAEQSSGTLSPVYLPNYTDNPFEDLNSELQELVVNISGIGFPLPRVARACRAFNGNEEKIMDFLTAMAEFLERGFPEAQVERALLESDNDRGQVLDLFAE